MNIHSAPRIVWFRDDLRITDHPALSAAARGGAPVICLYVRDHISPSLAAPAWRPPGGAARWWLSQSLGALASSLTSRGAALVLRSGPAAEVILSLAEEIGADAVYWNDIEQAPHLAVANDVAAALGERGVAVHRFADDLLAKPAAVRTKEGRGLRVFTPFWRRVLALSPPPKPVAAPRKITPGPAVAGDRLAEWKLEPKHPDWAGGLRAAWTPGEAAAHKHLQTFFDSGVAGYSKGRDIPEPGTTSKLSAHLRWGEISPRQIWHAARFAAADRPELTADIEKFLSELGWREFCRHLLFDVPDLATRNLQPSFNGFPWINDRANLAAWQQGRTGYPIIDAGMRELLHTGVMHNRVRMVAASFLVKQLLINWREGEQWFWDTLVDADAGSNPANWQWVAGCGADAAPYFRIFNPVLQGEKFDPDGVYVRKWVSELKDMPSKLIHKPWTATKTDLCDAGVVLGESYPMPIIDHKVGRERALSAYSSTRSS